MYKLMYFNSIKFDAFDGFVVKVKGKFLVIIKIK